ncbi:glycerophosphodiester phosphodiesterase family protein [Weeksellaceae bacterium TAE3-ERU29]|nr:glycerophosphodiester phosphodiesterase family protein [Weeksellaceae bacterium TAE3-ERU29]
MKNRYILILLAFLCWNIACKDAPEYQVEETQANTDYFHTNNVLISAHRGGSGLKNYPENCLETLKYLDGKGINLFEVDITQTSDNKLVLFHDDHLERLTTGNGSAKGKTAEDLRELNLVDDFGNETPYKIPYLEDVLKWGKRNNTYFMIDFKRGVPFEDVIDLIRKEKMENNVALISYTVPQAEKLHKLAPEMMISVSARNHEELNKILDTNIPHNKMLAFTGTRLSPQSLFDELKKLKIPINLGTLGNLDKKAEAGGDKLYKVWREQGVDIFSTDRPLEVYQQLK